MIRSKSSKKRPAHRGNMQMSAAEAMGMYKKPYQHYSNGGFEARVTNWPERQEKPRVDLSRFAHVSLDFQSPLSKSVVSRGSNRMESRMGRRVDAYNQGVFRWQPGQEDSRRRDYQPIHQQSINPLPFHQQVSHQEPVAFQQPLSFPPQHPMTFPPQQRMTFPPQQPFQFIQQFHPIQPYHPPQVSQRIMEPTFDPTELVPSNPEEAIQTIQSTNQNYPKDQPFVILANQNYKSHELFKNLQVRWIETTPIHPGDLEIKKHSLCIFFQHDEARFELALKRFDHVMYCSENVSREGMWLPPSQFSTFIESLRPTRLIEEWFEDQDAQFCDSIDPKRLLRLTFGPILNRSMETTINADVMKILSEFENLQKLFEAEIKDFVNLGIGKENSKKLYEFLHEKTIN